MVEYLQISCPSCQRTLRVRRQYAGHEVACSHCGNGFVVQPADDPHGAATHSESPSSQADSKADRATFERQVTELANEIEKVRADRQKISVELAYATEQWNRRTAERDQLGTQVQDLSAALEQLREQAQVDAVLRSELAESQTVLQQLQGHVQSLEAASDSLQQSFEEDRKGWESEREAALHELDSVRKQRDELAARCDAISASLRETENRLATQLEQLRQESTALRQDRDRLADEVQQAHERNRELADQIQSLESKLSQPAAVAAPADLQSTEELRSQVLKLQIQNDELRSVIHGLGITVG